MSLMHAREIEQLTSEQYDDAIGFIYRFYICYKIIGGMESNHLSDSIVKHSYAIELNCTQQVLDEWKIVLTKNCLQKKHFELISFRLDGLIRGRCIAKQS